VKHVPNLLSAARLLAAPYIFWLLWTKQFDTALVWFALAGITDALDGYLARKLHVESPTGAYLDPIADKVLLSGAFLILAMNGAIPTWLTVLVLGREGAILFVAGIFLLKKTRKSFPPTLAGKLSTAVQIVFILAVVAASAPPVLQWSVALVTAWSGLDYARLALLQRD